jgi:hypothetical protein
MGIDADHSLTMPIAQFIETWVTPDDRPLVAGWGNRPVGEFPAGFELSCEYRMVTPDGLRWMTVRAVVKPGDHKVLGCPACTDWRRCNSAAASMTV